MVDVIQRGEPAIMVAHWTGIYWNGEELGFKVFQEVVRRLEARFDHLLWMKLSEISRYWAAKELTRIEKVGDTLVVNAPFAAPRFTLRLTTSSGTPPKLVTRESRREFKEVSHRREIKTGTWLREGKDLTVCFDLPKGRTELLLG